MTVYHDVVFKVIEDMQSLLDGEKAIIYEEKKIGSTTLLKLYYSKVGTIAGTMLDEGVKTCCKVKVFRKCKLIHARIGWNTKTRHKMDVKEVEKGKDFGEALPRNLMTVVWWHCWIFKDVAVNI